MHFTRFWPSVEVASESYVDENGECFTSDETIGSGEYSTYLAYLAATPVRTTSFTDATVTGFLVNIVMSTREPFGTGTFNPRPVMRPSRCGISCSNTRAALVSVGMMFSVAARERRRSAAGTSASRWSL